MKNVFLLSFILLLASCNSKRTLIGGFASLISECSTNGNCSVELIRNKALVINGDEFGMHYSTTDNHEKAIVIYKYSKIVKGNIQDAGYREELVFEIDNSVENKTVTDLELQNTKMLFGRFCYCKGQTGYYKVEKGKLEMNSNTKTIVVNFTVDEVPQVIKHVAISLN